MKHISSREADYYLRKLNMGQAAAVRAKAFAKWLIGWPVQIWRIPVSLFLFFKTVFLFFCKIIYPPELGAAVGVIVLALFSFSAYKTYILFGAGVVLLFFYYVIYRYIYDSRDGFRKAYNRVKGYSEDFDEYENIYHEHYTEEQQEEYYYYRKTENKQYYEQHKYDGRYSNQDTDEEGLSPSNIFAGLEPKEAKDKYRDLMKVYHPDNKETGDAEKAKDIVSQYEEYMGNGT